MALLDTSQAEHLHIRIPIFPGLPVRLIIALLLIPAALAAQSPDTARGIPLPATDSALRLPVDRVGDLLPWLPGGSIDPDGRPTWRGRSISQAL